MTDNDKLSTYPVTYLQAYWHWVWAKDENRASGSCESWVEGGREYKRVEETGQAIDIWSLEHLLSIVKEGGAMTIVKEGDEWWLEVRHEDDW